MKPLLALFVLLVLATSGFAAEIRKGAIRQVKPNSIWFQEAEQLTRWQALKKGGDVEALASYERKLLSEREAWQFIHELPVKVLRIEPAKQRINVEMTTRGRMAGTRWFLDIDTIVRQRDAAE